MARDNADQSSGSRGLEATAMGGGLILACILSLGMAFSIHRFEELWSAQVGRLRAEEETITLVERLRWLAGHIAAAGRGYLLTGDSSLLAQVDASRSRFDETWARLEADPSPGRPELALEVQQAGVRFIAEQQELLSARRSSDDPQLLADRFETELLPLSRELDTALSRLVEHKQAALTARYELARQDRARLGARLYGLLGFLVFGAVAVAWHFSRKLGAAFQRERNALETARSAVAARDELMGIVAHDLRNPLGAITVRAALMRKDSESEQTRGEAASIERTALRMEYLIQTMLDVATMDAGRFAVNASACLVKDLVRGTVEMFGALAETKGLHFDQRMAEPGLAVYAECERVLQVLSNLVGNALTFTPPGGRVTLSVERAGDAVRFGVFDTGPGLSPENSGRVFERSFREGRGMTGTGLGLFIARAIVEAHGGRIWVESAPGEGSRFFFTLRSLEYSLQERLPPQAEAAPPPA